jgi:hypothetical protein
MTAEPTTERAKRAENARLRKEAEDQALAAIQHTIRPHHTEGYTRTIALTHGFSWNNSYQVVKPAVTDGLLPGETPDELAARLRADCLDELIEATSAFKDFLKRASTQSVRSYE